MTKYLKLGVLLGGLIGARVGLGAEGAGGVGGAGEADLGKVPYSISKETTGIVSPLRGDGSVDYVRALNERYGKGVTAENNGFVLYLQVVGTGGNVIVPEARDGMLKMLGVKETPVEGASWERFTNYLARVEKLKDSELLRANSELGVNSRKPGEMPWAAADRPRVAAYLKEREKDLAVMEEASKRSRWWVPTVPIAGRTLRTLYFPVAQTMTQIGAALNSRATMRAGGKDFDGFLADVMTAKRLARLMEIGSPADQMMPGYGIDKATTQTIAGVAASGMLSAAQCDALTAAMKTLPAMPGWDEHLDVAVRWGTLELVQVIAMNDQQKMDAATKETFGQIERDAVDWDVVLKMLNKRYDDQLKGYRAATIEEMDQVDAAVDKMLLPSAPPGGRGAAGMGGAGRAGEAREVNADRMARQIYFFERRQQELGNRWYREVVMMENMLTCVVGAAKYKAEKGAWPGALGELVPRYVKDVPRDIHSLLGAEEVNYVAGAAGIWVSSSPPVVHSPLITPSITTVGAEVGVGVK